jgi:RNA polymerase sigma-70 factor (ECF subfamily)
VSGRFWSPFFGKYLLPENGTYRISHTIELIRNPITTKGKAMETHADCLERIAAGDEVAFEELTTRMSGVIHAVFFRVGIPRTARETCEDLAQDVWIKVWRKAGSFIPGANELAWICSVAKNVAIDHLRKEKRRARIKQVEGLPDIFGQCDDRSFEAAEYILNVVKRRGSDKFVSVAREILAGSDKARIMETAGINCEVTLNWRIVRIRAILEESPEFTSIVLS